MMLFLARAAGARPTILQKRLLSLVSFDNSHVTVQLDSAPAPVSFSTVFLRDACDSESSVDKNSRQKTFTTASVAENLEIQGEPEVVKRESGDALAIEWVHRDGSTCSSSYSESFLVKSATLESRMAGKFFPEKQKYWTRKDLVQDLKAVTLDYHGYLEGDQSFARALEALNKYGICFVKNIDDPLENPKTQALSESNALMWPVAKLAQKFGYIKSTFYGTLFDVKNEKNATNIANTNVFLPLHMDLLYYESPPGLQLLHFIANSTTGGENVFVDSFAAATKVRSSDPEAYEALKQVPLTFHYDNNNEYYYYMRPLIVEEPYLKNWETGEALLKEVNYSPPFQGPLELGITAEENPKLFQDFLRGMVAFEKAVHEEAHQYVVKTPENTCVIFNNRRILHSRKQFTENGGGDRWLMGCYVDGDSFRSKLRTFHRKR